ncbi:hypothetical protein [Clostridium sp. E02]|uniref:hypothetical protein n=1 Tax=Clostridium sp. E02 TaxID=2487134 RepID=UPI000F5443F1|nr:hypothetical protein [Clostridium sp. E02]
MKRRLKGSYTIEAAFVMSIVLWAMLVSIQAAYCIRDEVVGSMAMAESVQRLRHNESESPGDADNWAKNRAGKPFSWKEYEYNIQMSGNPITGRKVNAFGRAGRWNLLIEQSVFDPENFLRMVTLLDQEE